MDRAAIKESEGEDAGFDVARGERDRNSNEARIITDKSIQGDMLGKHEAVSDITILDCDSTNMSAVIDNYIHNRSAPRPPRNTSDLGSSNDLFMAAPLQSPRNTSFEKADALKQEYLNKCAGGSKSGVESQSAKIDQGDVKAPVRSNELLGWIPTTGSSTADSRISDLSEYSRAVDIQTSSTGEGFASVQTIHKVASEPDQPHADDMLLDESQEDELETLTSTVTQDFEDISELDGNLIDVGSRAEVLRMVAVEGCGPVQEAEVNMIDHGDDNGGIAEVDYEEVLDSNSNNTDAACHDDEGIAAVDYGENVHPDSENADSVRRDDEQQEHDQGPSPTLQSDTEESTPRVGVDVPEINHQAGIFVLSSSQLAQQQNEVPKMHDRGDIQATLDSVALETAIPYSERNDDQQERSSDRSHSQPAHPTTEHHSQSIKSRSEQPQSRRSRHITDEEPVRTIPTPEQSMKRSVTSTYISWADIDESTLDDRKGFVVNKRRKLDDGRRSKIQRGQTHLPQAPSVVSISSSSKTEPNAPKGTPGPVAGYLHSERIQLKGKHLIQSDEGRSNEVYDELEEAELSDSELEDDHGGCRAREEELESQVKELEKSYLTLRGLTMERGSGIESHGPGDPIPKYLTDELQRKVARDEAKKWTVRIATRDKTNFELKFSHERKVEKLKVAHATALQRLQEKLYNKTQELSDFKARAKTQADSTKTQHSESITKLREERNAARQQYQDLEKDFKQAVKSEAEKRKSELLAKNKELQADLKLAETKHRDDRRELMHAYVAPVQTDEYERPDVSVVQFVQTMDLVDRLQDELESAHRRHAGRIRGEIELRLIQQRIANDAQEQLVLQRRATAALRMANQSLGERLEAVSRLAVVQAEQEASRASLWRRQGNANETACLGGETMHQ